MLVYALTDRHKSVRDNWFFGTKRGTIAEVHNGKHLLVMNDDRACTGAGGEGCVDDQVLGAKGHNTLNDIRRGMLAFSAENQFCLVNMLFSAPMR